MTITPERRAEHLLLGHVLPPAESVSLRRQIAQAIRVAVEAERQRCAAVAEQACVQSQGDARAIYERVLGNNR